MEKRTLMDVVQVQKFCPTCKTTKMIPTGIVLSSYPAQYPHICEDCGFTSTYDRTYPSIEYVERKQE